LRHVWLGTSQAGERLRAIIVMQLAIQIAGEMLASP
jgi:hypothetical protein